MAVTLPGPAGCAQLEDWEQSVLPHILQLLTAWVESGAKVQLEPGDLIGITKLVWADVSRFPTSWLDVFEYDGKYPGEILDITSGHELQVVGTAWTSKVAWDQVSSSCANSAIGKIY